MARAGAAAPARALRRLVLYPADVLRARCAPIADAAAPAVQALAADMLALVRAHNGLGLAAPQIGVSARLFVMRTPAAKTAQAARRLRRPARMLLAGAPPAFDVVINPSMTVLPPLGRAAGMGAGAASASASASPALGGEGVDGDGMALGFEACLSLPDYPALVRRHGRIEVSYTGADGRAVVEVLEGLPAVVFQHELDHLDGVLLPDREVKAFPHSTLEREMEAAQRRFRVGLMKFYNDAGEIEEGERRAQAVLR
jgi:peptide deformylase